MVVLTKINFVKKDMADSSSGDWGKWRSVWSLQINWRSRIRPANIIRLRGRKVESVETKISFSKVIISFPLKNENDLALRENPITMMTTHTTRVVALLQNLLCF